MDPYYDKEVLDEVSTQVEQQKTRCCNTPIKEIRMETKVEKVEVKVEAVVEKIGKLAKVVAFFKRLVPFKKK